MSDHLAELETRNADLNKELEMLRTALGELEATNANLVNATWRARELKPELERTAGELDEAKTLLDAQTKRMHESINYARNIQVSLTPSEADIRAHFPGSFMLYKPKDVVSGDFPWMAQVGSSVYLAAADCTGHGVPGAMLSAIGSVTMNGILNTYGEVSCGTLLDLLHAEVVKVLGQDRVGNLSRDGMDIALCRWDQASGKLEFSGAHRPLLHERDGHVKEIKGDKFPIGGTQYRKRTPFTTHSIDVGPGDRIFLFTDGLTDQFGGPGGKQKLTSERLRRLVERHSGSDIAAIGPHARTLIDTWQGTQTQLDDILLMGLEIPGDVAAQYGISSRMDRSALMRSVGDGLTAAGVSLFFNMRLHGNGWSVENGRDLSDQDPFDADLMKVLMSAALRNVTTTEEGPDQEHNTTRQAVFALVGSLGTEVAFSGPFDQETTKRLLAIMERRLITKGTDEGVRSKVMNVAMEVLQNMCKHRSKDDTAASVFMLAHHSGRWWVMAGNPIPKSSVKGLRTKLDHINLLDAEGLKAHFKEARLASKISSVGGAGLGFIDMAKRTGNPLIHDFQHLDDHYDYLSLIAYIHDLTVTTP